MGLQSLQQRLAEMPMLRIAVLVAVGIALSERVQAPLWLLAAAFATTGCAALALRSAGMAALAVLLTGFAAAELHRTEPALPGALQTLFAIRIEGFPTERNGYRTAEARVEAWRDPADGRWHAARERVMVGTDTLTRLEPGERLCVRSVLRPFRGAESYRRLMARRGFAGRIYLSERNLLERLPARRPGLHVGAVRRLEACGLAGERGALVRAMTAGERSGIGAQLRTAYARSGLMHLLAVSGLHTGIVLALVNLLLWWMPLLRYGHVMRNALVVAAVWLFVAAAGFPVSAVRAAVMCTLLQASLAAGSEYRSLNALGAAATGMLLWNPAWLSDIGFQLSVVAVAAILAWGVPLSRRLKSRRKWLDALTATLAVGFAASLSTAPLVSHTFGIVPLAGVALNPAVLVLATLVVGGGVVCMAAPPLACVAAPAALWAARMLDTLAVRIAALPGGTLAYTLPGGGVAALYLLFAAATLAAWSIEPKKSVHLHR